MTPQRQFFSFLQSQSSTVSYTDNPASSAQYQVLLFSLIQYSNTPVSAACIQYLDLFAFSLAPCANSIRPYIVSNSNSRGSLISPVSPGNVKKFLRRKPVHRRAFQGARKAGPGVQPLQPEMSLLLRLIQQA